MNIHIKILLLSSFLLQSIFANEVNIYTSRHYDADDILYEEFTKETGIKVNIISSSGSALMERLKSEGDNSPGDVFFTVDAGNLSKFQKEGFFQSIKSKKIKSVVPEELRGPNDEWVSIAKRARVIFYNPKNVSKNELEKLAVNSESVTKWTQGKALKRVIVLPGKLVNLVV